MNDFGHIEAMKVFSFSKYSKCYADFANAIKSPENVDTSQDNCVWTCCGSFCQLWQEYMWWGVNMLKSGPKISDPTKRTHTQFNLCDISLTLGQKCLRFRIDQCFGPIHMLISKGCSETGVLWH